MAGVGRSGSGWCDFSILRPAVSAKAPLCTSVEPNAWRLQCDPSRPSFPRRRAPLYFGGAEHPETSEPSLKTVIPAEAGIQRLQRHLSRPSFPRKRAPLYFGVAEHPETSASSFQSVIPAKAGIQRLQRHLSRPSFPRKRAPLYFGGAEHPATSRVLARKALDSRFRGNDGR
ncbi:hypothetical protein [Lysobacter gummosus]|uniref:hypothetical protein n=1 Tax=Lysobacter gummosus TaxID=262324 RepID=UPI0036250FC8